MFVRARAPLRVSFAGGGTDVSPFPETEGGIVLSTTIDRYVYGSIRRRTDGRISIESADLGTSLNFSVTEDVPAESKLELVMAALRRLAVRDQYGYRMVLRSGAAPGTGLGSSSALMVVLVGLLRQYYGLSRSNYEVAQLAYTIERKDLGIEGGIQDHYAASYGGLNLMEFSEQVEVNRVPVSGDVRRELELNLLLCYTGVSRNSAQILADQTGRMRAANPRALDGLKAQKELALAMHGALLGGQLNTFGELLGEAWQQKKLSEMITTPRIDEAYDIAIRHGALGGKATGAGGGGHMLFYCDFDRKHRVAEALTRHGLTIIDFGLTEEGLLLWRGLSS